MHRFVMYSSADYNENLGAMAAAIDSWMASCPIRVLHTVQTVAKSSLLLGFVYETVDEEPGKMASRDSAPKIADQQAKGIRPDDDDRWRQLPPEAELPY